MADAAIPRLPAVATPGLPDVLLSGWLLLDQADREIVLTTVGVTPNMEPGWTNVGAGLLLLLNKGLVFMPRLSLEDYAFRGDPYSIAKMAIQMATEFIIPFPEAISTAMDIGGKVSEMLDLDLRPPRFADAEAQHFFDRLTTDPRTFAIPYVNIVGWRRVNQRITLDVTSQIPDSTQHLVLDTEDEHGNRKTYVFPLARDLSDQFMDLMLIARWQQEFQSLIVDIVGEALHASDRWQGLQEVLLEIVGEAPATQLTLAEMRQQGGQPRFPFFSHPLCALLAAQRIIEILKEAGYRQYDALTMIYLQEETVRHRVMFDGGTSYAWLLAISEPKLASELLRRMEPNLAEQRAMLAENTISRALFRLSFVEMLERSASGEGIGRVHRIDGGPFY